MNNGYQQIVGVVNVYLKIAATRGDVGPPASETEARPGCPLLPLPRAGGKSIMVESHSECSHTIPHRSKRST